MWREIMDKVSSLGFYCLAPDMRGYSEDACPEGIQNYGIKNLREDVLNIADFVKKDKFHLVAHDWGAGIGWNIVYNNNDRVLSWTGLSVPHNSAFGEAIKQDKNQQKMSVYLNEFLVPDNPEISFRENDFKRLKKLWSQCSADEVENYLSVFSRKESLTAAINYYRANIGKGKNEVIGDINTPTLFIWGKNDEAVGSFAVERNEKYVKGDYTFLALDGGHWLVQTNYAEVETAIVKHLLKYKTEPNKS
jgi:pimeloyl-ACP methyl ester carboxylesterase